MAELMRERDLRSSHVGAFDHVLRAAMLFKVARLSWMTLRRVESSREHNDVSDLILMNIAQACVIDACWWTRAITHIGKQ